MILFSVMVLSKLVDFWELLKGIGLENRSPFAGTVGSNPTSSENKKAKAFALAFLFSEESE